MAYIKAEVTNAAIVARPADCEHKEEEASIDGLAGLAKADLRSRACLAALDAQHRDTLKLEAAIKSGLPTIISDIDAFGISGTFTFSEWNRFPIDSECWVVPHSTDNSAGVTMPLTSSSPFRSLRSTGIESIAT